MNKNMIVKQMREACREHGIKGAVIGISGGKDSTVVAALMTEVLGTENVLGVMMPNGVQSDISDSIRVVEFLGIQNMTVNIKDSFDGLFNNVDVALRGLGIETGVNEMARINIAPRIRTATLYAIAQSMGSGWRVIGTTNASENYIGWLTKWGDGAADFEPIIELTVSEVIALGKEFNLPIDLVEKTPIDGLSEGTDEERIGFTYAQLDKHINDGTCGDPIIDEKIERMHFYSEHKRQPIPHLYLNSDPEQRYNIYKVSPGACYFGFALVAAENAEKANEEIDCFKKVDSDNGCDSWGHSYVDESDVIENAYATEKGYIYNNIMYGG